MSLKVLMSSKALILLVTLIPMAVSDKLGSPCHTAGERVSIELYFPSRILSSLKMLSC